MRGGGGVFLVMDYMERLCPKGGPFPGYRGISERVGIPRVVKSMIYWGIQKGLLKYCDQQNLQTAKYSFKHFKGLYMQVDKYKLRCSTFSVFM